MVDLEAPPETAEPTPLLRGPYRIASLAGENVIASLVRDPSCYAGRALFTFGDDGTLSFSLETACEGGEAFETVCAAELTTPVEWEADAFRVPFAARARGTVSQFYQPESEADDTVADFDDSCHVGITPMRWRIVRSSGAELELENDHGDVMALVREDSNDVDWRSLVREAHLRRASAE
jgi:hypothetical protein